MTPQTENPLAGLSARGVALRLGLLLALLGGTFFLLIGLVPGAGERLGEADPGWVAVAVALEIGACAAYAWLFHVSFSHREYLVSPLRSAEIAVGELGAFAVVPTGVGGPMLRYWSLIRGGMPWRVSLVRSVPQAILFNFPYVAAAAVLGVSVLAGVGPGDASTSLALAPLGLVAAVLALAGGALLWVRTRKGPPRSAWRLRAREIVETIPDGLRETPSRLRRPGGLLGGIGFWAGDCAVLVVAFQAAGGEAPLLVIVLAYMLGQLGSTLPLPGGVGGVEPLILGVLTASGVDAGLGAAAIVLYRVVSLGTQAILGSIAVAALLPSLAAEPEPSSG